MSERLHVLIVEDNPADVDLMRDALPETGLIQFHSESVPRLSEALTRLTTGGIDLVLTDLGLPDSQGLATFRELRQAAPDLAIIVLTGNDDQEMAVAAVREGAQDFLVKGQISGDLLVRAVRYAIERKRMEVEKAELEAQNRQLQKAESLSRMVAAIVHHFNNILQVIIGNMQLAIRQLPRDSGSVKNMTAAMQAAREAEAITNQTMTYLGDTSDKLEPLDLCDVCRLGLPMLQAAIPKNVTLETDLPSRGPTITANANQMQQVLTNLLTNAWESVGDGLGVIHLRVKMVSAADIPTIHSPADWRPQDSVYGCLEVTDTGCGIAHSDIEKLFDPFFSSKLIGRGLGLAVVLGIAKAHHGAVAVQSDPGQGSTFRVFFPASAENVVV